MRQASAQVLGAGLDRALTKAGISCACGPKLSRDRLACRNKAGRLRVSRAMPIQVQDIIKVNVVFVGTDLLVHPEEKARFCESHGMQQMTAMAVTEDGVGPSSRMELARDRLSLELAKRRAIAEVEYPTDVDVAKRTGSLISDAVAMSHDPAPPSAYGFNMEMVYDPGLDGGDTAFSYLSRALFVPGRFPIGALVGGSAKLQFGGDHGMTWAVTIEPRFNRPDAQQVFAQVNLHVPRSELPSNDETGRLVGVLWDGAHKFIDAVDERR